MTMRTTKNRYLLTTIDSGMVAIVESDEDPIIKGGCQREYRVSNDFVQKNTLSGAFTDVTKQVPGATGKVFVLTSDLN